MCNNVRVMALGGSCYKGLQCGVSAEDELSVPLQIVSGLHERLAGIYNRSQLHDQSLSVEFTGKKLAEMIGNLWGNVTFSSSSRNGPMSPK